MKYVGILYRLRNKVPSQILNMVYGIECMLILNFIANITVLSDLYNINYMYTLKHSYLFLKKNTKTPNYAAQNCNHYHSSKMYHSSKTVSYDSKNKKKSIQQST